MYTQSFNVPDSSEAPTGPKAVPQDAALQAQFDARIDADGKIEPREWMPERRVAACFCGRACFGACFLPGAQVIDNGLDLLMIKPLERM